SASFSPFGIVIERILSPPPRAGMSYAHSHRASAGLIIVGEGQQFGRNFEAEPFCAPATEPVETVSPTLQPDWKAGVIRATPTLVFSWAERSRASLPPTTVSAAART